MAGEDEATIVIRGDAAGAVAAIQQTERALTQLQRAASGSVTDTVRAASAGADLHRRNAAIIEEAGRKSLAARAAQVKAAAEQAAADRKAAIASVDAWAKADVTGMFRPWIDARKQWLEGAEQVGAAAMTQRAALLALGGAAAASAVAFAAAGAAVVASSIEIITNLDQYSNVTMRHRAALEEAAAATAFFNQQVTELRVEIAGQMAPAISDASDAASGLTMAAGATAVAISDMDEDVKAHAATMFSYIPVVGSATTRLLGLAEAFAATGRQARETAEAMNTFVGPLDTRTFMGRPLGPAEAPRVNMEAEAEAARAAQETAESYILAGVASTTRAAKTAALTTATRLQTEQDREAGLAVKGLTDAWGKATGALDGYMAQLDAANAQAARAAQNVRDTGQAGNVAAGRSPGAGPPDPATAAALADNVATASGAAAKATGAQWRMAAQEVMGATSSMVGSVGSFIAESYAKQAEGANKYSQAHRNAMRKAFAAQKAAALAQAAISLALGIMQVWSSWSALPPVAAALTAVVGAVGAVQIGLIAAQKPSFHRGGLYQMSPGQAPDERAASVSMLQSERLAIIPQRGSLGAEGEVSRRSTGERSADAPAPPLVYIMDGSGRRSTRPFAGLSPLMGRRQIA